MYDLKLSKTQVITILNLNIFNFKVKNINSFHNFVIHIVEIKLLF